MQVTITFQDKQTLQHYKKVCDVQEAIRILPMLEQNTVWFVIEAETTPKDLKLDTSGVFSPESFH